MINKSTPWWQTGALVCTLILASCGGAETEQAPVQEPEAPTLEQAIAERGEPCNCVAENQEAMTGLLESLKSTERVTAQEINIQIAQMMLPCMKPTGNTELDREYSRAMGQCEGFAALTDVMTEVKEEVQARVTQEAAQERATDLDGAKGANAVLNKLKGS